MADYRKFQIAFGVVFGLGLGGCAWAQPLVCSAHSGVPPIARDAGVTEPVGDLVLTCTGGTPTPAGQPIPQIDISILLNAGITSRLLSGIATIGGISEAILSIDEPFPSGSQVPPTLPLPAGVPATQLGCVADNFTNCATLGTGGGFGAAGPYNGSPGHPNLFQGSWNPNLPNAIFWTGIPIDPPGTSTTRIIRITNLRANASELTCVAGVPAEIFELVSITGSQAIAVSNPQQPVGFIFPGVVSGTSPSGDVSASEGFAAAFKPRDFNQYSGSVSSPISSAAANGLQNVLGSFNYNSESGFVTSAAGLLGDGTTQGAMGLADTGTELAFQFTGASDGTAITVPNVIYLYPVGTLVTAVTGVTGATGVALLAGQAFAPGTNTQLFFSGGSATATYEVLLSNPSVVEFAFLPSPGASVSGSASFAPASNAPLTTYTYNGNHFTSSLPPYTTSDSVTGTFTTSSPLPGGLSFGNNPGGCGLCPGNISSLVTNYSFFDGINTWNPTNTATSGLFADAFYVSTDAQGNIVSWLIVLRGITGPFQFDPDTAELATNSAFAGIAEDQVQFLPTANTFADGIVFNHPGTWSISHTASAADPVAPIPRFLGSSGCPVPIPSTQFAATASGLLLSRVTGTFNGTVTIKNTGTSSINGPIQIGFENLNFGVYLSNATGVSSFVGPYITAPVSNLPPGQTVQVNVQFKNLSAPPSVKINFTPVVYSGSI